MNQLREWKKAHSGEENNKKERENNTAAAFYELQKYFTIKFNGKNAHTQRVWKIKAVKRRQAGSRSENHVAIMQKQQQFVHLSVDSANSSFGWRWMCCRGWHVVLSDWKLSENASKRISKQRMNKKGEQTRCERWIEWDSMEKEQERTRKVTICVYLRSMGWTICTGGRKTRWCSMVVPLLFLTIWRDLIIKCNAYILAKWNRLNEK